VCGDLQLAIWQRQFAARRDGVRFFYAHAPALVDMEHRYGISFRRTLAQVIQQNSDGHVQSNVFRIDSHRVSPRGRLSR
jgi:hypothetical protein